MPPNLMRVRARSHVVLLLSENDDWSKIPEGVLPLVADVDGRFGAGELELRKARRRRGERRDVDAELRTEVSGDEPALPIARVDAVAAAEFVDHRARPDPRPAGRQRRRRLDCDRAGRGW